VNALRLLALGFGVLLTIVSTALAEQVPVRPEFGIIDQASIFPLPILKLTERMISEHERLTLEQISIYTIAEKPMASLSDTADAVFEEWRKVAPRPSSSILMLVDGGTGDVEFRTGLGLDPIFPAAKITDIRKRIFKPEWQAGKKSRALVLSFVEILRSLDSPLVSGDEVTEAYEHAGFTGSWVPAVPPGKSVMAWVYAVIGLIIAAFVLVRIQIGEVHYTAAGWFPVPASKNLSRLFRRRKKIASLVTGGGISGSY
jgi:uncharacterized membrane protein YgcG